jgi:CRISPR-associated protein Cst2
MNPIKNSIDSKYCFICILTPFGIASNNRGEGDGTNISTLQKISNGEEEFTTVSSEAIRWAYREYLGNKYPEQVNRIYDTVIDEYHIKDEGYDANKYIDDDVFGYMDAKKDSKNKNATTKRRGVLEVARAISLSPYNGDKIFNATAGMKTSTSLYSVETHYTQYQYTIGFKMGDFIVPERAKYLLEAICNVRHVGGNHSRFLYDFGPSSLIARITNSPSPQIINCFDRDGVPRKLESLINYGDIPPEEIIVGGEAALGGIGETLEKMEATICYGIKESIGVIEYALFKQS